MRYYGLCLKSNQKQMEQTQKIRLKDYSYNCAIAAVNDYLYQFLQNGVNFLAYREEENKIRAIFSFDEQVCGYDKAFGHLTDMLDSIFDYKGLIGEPYEMTMSDYYDATLECRRRQLMDRGFQAMYDNAGLWLHYYIRDIDKNKYPFRFEEQLVSDKKDKVPDIYDSSLKNELRNIEQHSVEPDAAGVMAHYYLSVNSLQASKEMLGALASTLYRAGRLTSRRINIISEMVPSLYCRDNYFEDMMENNYGGMIVFCLREKLGYSPTAYGMTCQYIEQMFKCYKNKCVFAFVYEKNDPGISFYLLPEIRKRAMCVELKEGKGDKKAAEKYLRRLIAHSEDPGRASYTKEFMKQFPQKEFSQTDVMEAFEKFEPWCFNKKMEGMYDYDMQDTFYLDRDPADTSPYERLWKLIGLDKVKKQIDGIIASDIVEKMRKDYKGNSYDEGSLHMIFAGNPGSAKTTVAKLFAGIAAEKGILESGVFVETGGMDLNYMLPPMIRDRFVAAKGGVLFIDEAYSLTDPMSIATLIQEMENHREDVIVILAGYNSDMEAFLKRNDGLKSRIPHWVDFPDYSVDELTEIFKLMAKERGFTLEADAVKEARYIFKKAICITNFGNGRYVRNILDQAILNQASRLLADGRDKEAIKKAELFTLKKEDITALDEGRAEESGNEAGERKPGAAKEELDNMVGLEPVKNIIRKAVANAKLNKLCLEKGIKRENTSLHMVFTGNPGTAKTTVARLFAEIMKDEKILDFGKFIEVGRADLIGEHVGQTAPLVKRRFKEAQGGVLFIDEAYSLYEDYENGFGDEAISTIVQEMENQRDKVVVIFAGYPEPMQDFLDRNPGMRSRIAFHVDFDDYSREELCDITKRMLSKKHYTITDNAMCKLEHIYDKVCGKEDYGNGRFARKMIEKAEMNLAERLMAYPEDQITKELITTLEECDIPDYDDPDITGSVSQTVRLGFAS